jgi:hypothetical protein
MCPLLSHGQQGGAIADILRMQPWHTPPQEQLFALKCMPGFCSRSRATEEAQLAELETPAPVSIPQAPLVPERQCTERPRGGLCSSLMHQTLLQLCLHTSSAASARCVMAFAPVVVVLSMSCSLYATALVRL